MLDKSESSETSTPRQLTDPDFTVDMGRMRAHGGAAKYLLYGVEDKDAEPEKKLGKRGACTVSQTLAQSAPFAMGESTEAEDNDASKTTAKKDHKKVQTKVGCDLYDSEVYSNNRAYNIQNKQDSIRKASYGSGNILSHVAHVPSVVCETDSNLPSLQKLASCNGEFDLRVDGRWVGRARLLDDEQ